VVISKLLHAENIAIAPEWMPIQQGATIKFNLIFSQLPKTCSMFDLIEEWQVDESLKLSCIQRVTDDIYNVNIETTEINFWTSCK
jgi:hypothetical protein